MTPRYFDKLIATTRLGMRMKGQGKPRSLMAARLHLVGGMPVSQAAEKMGISTAAVYIVLNKIPRDRCPQCGGPVRARDTKTPDRRIQQQA